MLKHADMSGSASCDVSQGVSRIVEMQSTDLHSAFRPHIHHEVTRQEKEKTHPIHGLGHNHSSRVRSTTSLAALPTTIGEGDLSSRFTDEVECSATKEFSSAYTHGSQV